MSGDDLTQYRQMYVDETEEQLDDLVETMLVLEEDPADKVSLATAFRLLHSMKGAAGMMGFDQITALTHHLETRFERLRSGRIQLDRVTMNLTLRCIDFLRQCNEQLRGNVDLATPDVLLAELRELEEQTERTVVAEDAAAEVSAGRVQANLATEEPTEDEPEIDDAETHYHLVIHFDREVFDGEINEDSTAFERVQLFLRTLEDFGQIEATRPDQDELESVDSIETIDVILLTSNQPESLAEAAFVEAVKHVEVRVPRDADAAPLATRTRLLSKPKPEFAPELEFESEHVAYSATSDLEPVTNVKIEPQPRSSVNPAASPALNPTAKAGETMRVDIDRLDTLMSLAGELVVNRAQFVEVAKNLGADLKLSANVNRSREFQHALGQAIAKLRNLIHGSERSEWASVIDELENGLDAMRGQQQILEVSRRNFGKLDEAIDQLSRVSSSMQRGILGTRMVPISPLFNRFKRVVRDLAIDRNKQVVLLIEGEQTELDKRMIDALNDPLVHLVRNSIDHGMESSEQRIANGKPVEGTIRLSAKHRGNHIHLRVEDDGGGIDDQKIRSKLVKLGWMDQATASGISRQAAIDMIWQPGFSTADKVTDVSGRGVGMDIVKSKIQELSGSIEIHSTPGGGTVFMIKLPLTLAIIGSLMVKIRDGVFAIPNEDIREIVQLSDDEVIGIHNQRTFEVRGQFLPLLTIDELFHWNGQRCDRETPETIGDAEPLRSREVVVLQFQDQALGLVVDAAIGSEDVVIKSLTENFVGIDGLAGASIMGNGSVALMLDVAALFRKSIVR